MIEQLKKRVTETLTQNGVRVFHQRDVVMGGNQTQELIQVGVVPNLLDWFDRQHIFTMMEDIANEFKVPYKFIANENLLAFYVCVPKEPVSQ